MARGDLKFMSAIMAARLSGSVRPLGRQFQDGESRLKNYPGKWQGSQGGSAREVPEDGTSISEVIETKKLALIALAVLAMATFADEYEQYCPTVYAIYGICSPELVRNWLEHRNDTYQTHPAIIIEKPLEAVPQFPPMAITSIGTEAGPAAQKYCWWDIGGNELCHGSGITRTGRTLKEPPEGCHYSLGGMLSCPEKPKPEVWFKNKIWMVS